MPRAFGVVTVVALVVVAAVAGVYVVGSASSTAPSFSEFLRGDNGAVTALDGVLPNGTTVFDGQYPGVANLDPKLLSALRAAAADAATDGVELELNSGWRSRTYQNVLLSQAIRQYGSEQAAARWVATADTSPHVSGEAADIGPSPADEWLSRHGRAYGLCQIYRNEPWHYELRPKAVASGCPRMFADPTRDPRMAGTAFPTSR